MNKKEKTIRAYYPSGKTIFIFFAFCIVFLNVFLRFFELEKRLQFTWDQIENAWVMKDILIDGKRPLLGMQAKASSGFSIGPLYYYFLAPFYAATNLDPIAGGYFAGFISFITVSVLLYASWKMYGKRVSLLSSFIYSVSYYVISFDRIAWPVNLIPLISIGIYFSLWNIVQKRPIFYIVLGILSGLAFHVHLTAIFFPLICVPVLFLSQPKKKDIPYIIAGLLVFILFFLPMIIAAFTQNKTMTIHMSEYYQTTFHGFHFRRVLQLIPDSLIDIGAILYYSFLSPIKFFILPLFCLFILKNKIVHKKLLILQTILFFAIPVLVLSTFRGELSNYYYSITRPVTVLMLAYIFSAFSRYSKLTAVVTFMALVLYGYSNIQQFVSALDPAYPRAKEKAIKAVKNNEHVDFVMGDAKSYLYFFYLYRKEGIWPK